MSSNIKYWKGEEELSRDPKFLAAQKNEFQEDLPLDEIFSDSGVELQSNRRDFLKYFGFSVTAVALAACYKTQVRHAVPYLVKPEDVTPGVANYYRSTCGACSSACGIEVKVREGRPIKIDGNPDSVISKGGSCAVGQASILSLYDTERLANPTVNGSENSDWTAIDSEVASKLKSIATANGKIVILSNSIHSPSTLKSIEAFKTAYPTTEHIMFDAVSYAGILEANEADFGKRVIPTYHFDKAKVIVSFAADFLGTWISPVEFTKGYSPNRIPSKEGMSKHIQFESNLSTTGTNADYRFPMKSSQEALYLASLYNAIASATGAKQIAVAQQGELAGNAIKKTADALLAAKGASLVVSGSNEVENQKIVNAINMLLGNYNATINLNNYSKQYQGSDKKTAEVLAGLQNGSVQGVIFYNTNPVYNLGKDAWTEAIKKAKVSISLASTKDETASACQYVMPDSHFLESWNDAEPKLGVYQFTQPTIGHVFNTRQAQWTLLSLANAVPAVEKDPLAAKGIFSQKFTSSPYYLFIKNNWSATLSNDESFNAALEQGMLAVGEMTPAAPSYAGDVSALAAFVTNASKSSGLDLVLYQATGVRDGAHGNNPWLHEMPDPVSKVSWDNYVAVPKSLAVKMNIADGDTVNVKLGDVVYNNVPALVQPGQANGTVSLALGYGRTHAGKVGGSVDKGYASVGVNAYPFVTSIAGNRKYVISGVEITKGDETYALAQTQTHHSIEGRDIVRESNFEAWKSNPKAGNDKPKTHVYTVWEKAEYRKDGAPNHLWAMAIDLNACTGCGTCVVSCSIENNVPVVGRDEIRLRREMHWIRIDRYYAFNSKNESVTREKEISKIDSSDNGEYSHWENVSVIHQPMMCQHCAQAPCETVCPVLATTHSSEGLNQMTYNRCIGTKYCGNNCPYKVRRFNWFRYNDNDNFDFHFNNPLGKMVINPDVTVRTRGVMEKCSFCVQRIQEGKLKAKREGKSPNEVEVKTACMKACPANAIVFGDLHNPESEVSKLYKNERGFTVLEELNVQSSIMYMTKIRNTDHV